MPEMPKVAIAAILILIRGTMFQDYWRIAAEGGNGKNVWYSMGVYTNENERTTVYVFHRKTACQQKFPV